MKKRILSVVGARPNFMKIAPFVQALRRRADRFEPLLVHTGQHYDREMSESFFQSLDIPAPDLHLGVGSGTHAEQVGRTMIEFEKVVRTVRPDWVVVVGDVNATCACSITAKKEGVRVAHIEAGLRSFDLGMPEEINRMVTDRLSDLLFTPDEISGGHLRREGVPEERIRFVGNIMIDTLDAHRARAEAMDLNAVVCDHAIDPAARGLASLPLRPGGFLVLTLHRPSNVDARGALEPLVRFLADEAAHNLPLVWTVHPRTRKQLEAFGLWDGLARHPRMLLLKPVDYHAMLKLNLEARVLLTDSGGLQEEACVLGTPCVTLRDNTERPITLVEHGGVSVLTGHDVDRVRRALAWGLSTPRKPFRPPLWDGRTADRIAAALTEEMPHAEARSTERPVGGR
jgi:UDP-N-acetylglucosamine 2-epimerase (non-hydrolysing)